MRNLMSDMHEALLVFCLWWLRFDLALARHTGRNPAWISAVQQDIDRMEADLFLLRLNRGRST